MGSVWMPDLEIYNSIEYGEGYFTDLMAKRRQHALIYSNGKVLYIPPVHGLVQCNDAEFADWPWGEYDCNLKLGSWTFDANMLNLTKYEDKNHIDVEDVIENTKMIFTEDSFKNDPREVKKYDCCEEPYVSLNYKFKVQRKYKMTDKGRENNPSLKAPFKPAKK